MDQKAAAETDVEIDVRALLSKLIRRLPYIVVFVGVVAVATFMGLDRLAPVYKSEATIIIETGESELTRSAQSGPPAAVPDKEAIASQIQLIRSREVADAVARQLDLKSRPEFNAELAPPSATADILTVLGLGSTTLGPTDDRVLEAYFRRLEVYAVEQSRVIGIDFSSTDPTLAADAANAIADAYIAIQREAKRSSTSSAAQFLSRQIDDLRGKLVEAEAKVEAFRADNDLFTGSGQSAATLPEQQLADLNGELTKVRTTRADAEAKAGQIRAALRAGAVLNIPEVLNSPLIQGLIQQQVAMKSQEAQLSATLLPQHPRMRELTAQLVDLDHQIAVETGKILDSFEADARLAAAREEAITRNLTDLKSAATKAGAAGVRLAALQREAAVQRDLLDQYLRSYREALAREQTGYLPADARVISRAAVQLEPDFPKKLPMTAAVSAAATILAIAVVLLGELASGRPMRRVAFAEPLPAVRPRRVSRLDDRRGQNDEPPLDHDGGQEAEPLRHHRHRPDNQPALDHDGRQAAEPPRYHRRVPDNVPPSYRPDLSEPIAAPTLAGEIEESPEALADALRGKQARAILVGVADGSGPEGRPLAALALARTLAASEANVVLVDFCDDGGNAAAVGEGDGEPGLADVLDGTASLADVLLRDARSRVHFVPPGTRVLAPGELDDEALETFLAALGLTYHHVILDARAEVIGRIAPLVASAIIASVFPAGDPRTQRAFERIRSVSSADVNFVMIEPGDGVERAARATAVA